MLTNADKIFILTSNHLIFSNLKSQISSLTPHRLISALNSNLPINSYPAFVKCTLSF